QFLALLLSPFFFLNDTATTELYTLSLHDALPISKTTARYMPGSGEELPPAPEGYMWVVETPAMGFQPGGHYQARLVPLELDEDGFVTLPANMPGYSVVGLPEGAEFRQNTGVLGAIDRFMEDPNMALGDILGQGGEWVMDAAGWANDAISGIVPQNFKDWWNENVEKPLDIAIRSGALDGVAREFESIPIVGPIISGILRN